MRTVVLLGLLGCASAPIRPAPVVEPWHDRCLASFYGHDRPCFAITADDADAIRAALGAYHHDADAQTVLDRPSGANQIAGFWVETYGDGLRLTAVLHTSPGSEHGVRALVRRTETGWEVVSLESYSRILPRPLA